MNNRGRIVAGIFACAIRIIQYGRAEYIIRVSVSLAHSLIDHVGETHIGIPAHVHTHFHKDGHNTCVLTDRPVAHGAHARVDQYLCHGIFGRFRLLAIVGFFYCFDKIGRVIVRNILQSICNTLNNILLTNSSHGFY